MSATQQGVEESIHDKLMAKLAPAEELAAPISAPEEDVEEEIVADATEEAVEETIKLAGDVLNRTVRAHARITAEHLKESKPILKRLVESGELKVFAAIYDLKTGNVQIL